MIRGPIASRSSDKVGWRGALVAMRARSSADQWAETAARWAGVHMV